MAARHPDHPERETRSWLETHFQAGIAASVEPAHQIYDADGRPRHVTPAHFGRLVRKLKIFRWLDRLEFGSFLDVASGWEHVPALVHERYRVPAFYSDMVHEMNLPKEGLEFGKLDHAVTLQLPVLPFKDGAFDVVLCSEVFEHLVRPVEAIAELLRVARRYVVLTTLEGLATDRWQRMLSHLRIDVRVPHVERNFLVLDEFAALFGDFVHENLLFNPAMPASLFDPPAAQAPAYAALDDVAALEAALCRAASDGRHGAGALGIVLVKPIAGAPIRPWPPRPGAERELARWLIAKAAHEEQHGQIVLAVWEAFRLNPALRPKDPAPDRPVAPGLLALLRCPDCRADLIGDGAGLRCTACARVFSGEYGVPILYPADPARSAPSAEESLARLCGADARRRLIVDRLMRRLRRNERPPGALARLLRRLAAARP